MNDLRYNYPYLLLIVSYFLVKKCNTINILENNLDKIILDKFYWYKLSKNPIFEQWNDMK